MFLARRGFLEKDGVGEGRVELDDEMRGKRIMLRKPRPFLFRSPNINGKKVRIPANLADFIDTITQLWTPVPPFWVDAICISQNNFAEKNIPGA